jgi:hypothetical protein
MIETRLCRCGHDRRVHDPCSRCECPAFVDPATAPPRRFRPRKGA